MRRFCDLHTHSTASDGKLTAAEVIALADKCQMAAVSLTDHDTVDGLAEAAAEAAKYPQMDFIPGVEFSAECSFGEMHILGYFIDPAAEKLTQMVKHMADGRSRRNPAMIEKLHSCGANITMDDLLCQTGGDESIIGRAHFARALRKKGYISTEQQAFTKYIGRGAPAYVSRVRASSADIIEAINSSGGFAALAHPVHLDYENYYRCETIVRDLVDKGLKAIEAYHSHHTDKDTRFFLQLAKKHSLLVTGGSDFHGRLGETVGRVKTPVMFAEKMMAVNSQS